jgi:hypothetical protein
MSRSKLEASLKRAYKIEDQIEGFTHNENHAKRKGTSGPFIDRYCTGNYF